MQHQRSSDQKFLVLLVLLILLVFRPLAIGLKTLKWDAADLTLPAFSLIRAALWNGEWALWNPLQNQGWATGIVPTFWNPVYLTTGGIFSDPIKALNAVYLLLLMVAGWGFYKFSGLFFERKNTAIIAGLLYPLSGFFLAHSQHIGWLEGAAWTPALLYLSHRCYRDGKRHHFFFLAASFYLFSTAAYPGYVLTMVYFLIFQAGYHFVTSFRSSRNTAASLRLPVMIALATGVLSALTWKCYYEQFSYITRGSGEWAIQTGAGSSFLSDYLSLIFSKSATVATASFWQTDPAFVSSFFGILVLFFAGYSILKRPDRTDRLLVLTALFFLLISLADQLPLRTWLNLLPGFAFFRMAALYRIYLIMAVIILGLRGMEKGLRYNDKIRLGIALIAVWMIIFGIQQLLLNHVRIPAEELPDWQLALWTDLIKSAVFSGLAAVTLFTGFRFMPLALGVLAVGEAALSNYLNQSALVYSPVPAAAMAPAVIGPEKKQLSYDLTTPIGKYRDFDFQTGSLYRNTGTLTRRLSEDGYWPYESQFHFRLENSGNYEKQLRFPLWYFSKDTGTFLMPDFLNFEDSFEIKEWTLTRSTLEISSRTPIILVFNQNYHPYWKAEIDGRATPLRRTNESMMKISVPAGHHHLQMHFSPNGSDHLFIVTMIILLVMTGILIRNGRWPYYYLYLSAPVLILLLTELGGAPSPEDTVKESTPPPDFSMNYESKEDHWYFRPGQITTADSYDGYRAERLDEKDLYSATLNIPAAELSGVDSLSYLFQIRSDAAARPAVVLRSYTENDDIYKIHYLKSFHMENWMTLEGGFRIPETEEVLTRIEFYIWNHHKDTFLIDDLQLRLHR